MGRWPVPNWRNDGPKANENRVQEGGTSGRKMGANGANESVWSVPFLFLKLMALRGLETV